MLTLNPIFLLKKLMGYGGGVKPSVSGSDKLVAGAGMSGIDPMWQYYKQQMESVQDRNQMYTEMERMDEDDIPEAALTLYCEDATQVDLNTGKVIWIESESPDIEEIGNQTLDEVEAQEEIFGVARDMCLYGDEFDAVLQERLPNGVPGGVIGLHPISPREIFRHEDELGRLKGFSRGAVPDSTTRVDPPWAFVHFRLIYRQRGQYKYGRALFAPARRVYRRLRMSEDAITLYRIKMAPNRLVWYFKPEALEGLPAEERQRVIQAVKNELRKNQFVDKSTGEIKQEMNPLSIDEDFFVDEGILHVDKLEGTDRIGPILDIDYHRKRFFSAIRVPSDYLGFTEAKGGLFNSQTNLSSQDQQFARGVKRIQNAIIRGYARLIHINMCWRGIDPTLAQNDFVVKMCPVSYLDEIQRNEALKVRAEIVETMESLGKRLDVDKEEWLSFALKIAGFPERLVQSIGKRAKEDVLQGKIELKDDVKEVMKNQMSEKIKGLLSKWLKVEPSSKKGSDLLYEGLPEVDEIPLTEREKMSVEEAVGRGLVESVMSAEEVESEVPA